MSTQTLAPDFPQSLSLDVLSPRAVEARLGLDATTMSRMRKRGEFPQPIRLSPGRVGYRRSDVEQWLLTRAQARIDSQKDRG
jgi:prophage regulatory protein